MNHCYPVYMSKTTVGSVTVEEKGLYYSFRGSCVLPKERIYALWVQNGSEEIKLGICVPEGTGFQIDTKLPAKRFLNKEFRFFVLEHNSGPQEFHPVCHDGTFSQLDQLKRACFKTIDGKTGICVVREDCDPKANSPG